MRQKKLVYYGKKCLIFLISVFILSVAVFYVAPSGAWRSSDLLLWRPYREDESGRT